MQAASLRKVADGATVWMCSILHASQHKLGCVREQAQGYCGQPVKYHGMVDVLTKTVANEGFRGLYKVRLLLPWSVLLH